MHFPKTKYFRVHPRLVISEFFFFITDSLRVWEWPWIQRLDSCDCRWGKTREKECSSKMRKNVLVRWLSISLMLWIRICHHEQMWFSFLPQPHYNICPWTEQDVRPRHPWSHFSVQWTFPSSGGKGWGWNAKQTQAVAVPSTPGGAQRD